MGVGDVALLSIASSEGVRVNKKCMVYEKRRRRKREHGHSAACFIVTVGCAAVSLCLQSVLGQALTLLSYSSVWL